MSRVSSRKSQEVFRYEKSLLSIAPGEIVQFPLFVIMGRYSSFHVHHLNNASVDANIYWSATVGGEIALEKTIAIPATIGTVGGLISSTTKSLFLHITFTNTDIVPLTDIYVSVFGIN